MRVAEQALLRVDNLTKVFLSRTGLTSSRFVAVDRASFVLPMGQHEILTLAGESGSGKTTLARMILGMLEPSAGQLVFKERNVLTLKDRERRDWFRREVQPVFQDPFATFNPLRRVDSYLRETARNFRADANIERALADVGLSLREVQGRYPNELSGGQLQRISIARALITSPSLLVADEPVSMLDASLRMSIVNLFRELKERQSVIYITHDLATAYYASDRVAIMLRGWIVEFGPVRRVLGEPLHPYTQLLKSSVLEPVPRASKQTEHVSLAVADTAAYHAGGCRFAGRCPKVMDICRTTEPANVLVDDRLVKCHLFAPTVGEAVSAGGLMNNSVKGSTIDGMAEPEHGTGAPV